MDVMIDKNNKIKKLRLITSFLIITISIILLIYAITIYNSIVLIVFLILIFKIIDLILILNRIRRKKVNINYKTNRTKA
jgi:hypothetical protein